MKKIKKQFYFPPEGCVPSPLDLRDVPLSAVSPIPARIAPEYPPPFDLTISFQNGYPHCVGHATASLKQEKELREKNSELFDGDWIYKKCKEIDNYPGGGTYLRTAMKIIQKVGAKPKDKPETEASKYRIGGYARVDDLSFEGLKRAIYVNGALLAAFQGSNAGWKTAYPRQPKSGENVWGHAIAMIGYNKDYIICQNSWGADWGDKGLFYISKDYIPVEAWAILTDLPNDYLIESGLVGFAAKEYLRADEFVLGQEVYTTTRLNLRREPNGDKITTLSKKQSLIVLGEPKKSGNYNWVRVKVV